MTLMLKFAAAFAIGGLIVSTAFGFIGGNRVTSIIITSIICTMLSGGLGIAVYQILEQRVPEFLDIFRSDVAYETAENDESGDTAYSSGEGTDYEASEEDDQKVAATQDIKTFGDHIIVGDIQLKNEPSLMAAAIQTLLAKDDDST